MPSTTRQFKVCPRCGARSKAFCAATIADVIGEDFFDKTMAWLDTEQREVTDEHKEDANGN